MCGLAGLRAGGISAFRPSAGARARVVLRWIASQCGAVQCAALRCAALPCACVISKSSFRDGVCSPTLRMSSAQQASRPISPGGTHAGRGGSRSSKCTDTPTIKSQHQPQPAAQVHGALARELTFGDDAEPTAAAEAAAVDADTVPPGSADSSACPDGASEQADAPPEQAESAVYETQMYLASMLPVHGSVHAPEAADDRVSAHADHSSDASKTQALQVVDSVFG